MTKPSITEFARQVMQSHHLVGLAVGLVQDGRQLCASAWGVEDIESGETLTVNTLFHLASISKLFTATAVMQLVEQGKIDLEDSPVKYVPYLKLDKNVTIRQMLSHVSGFSDVTDYHWDKPEYDDEALERYVRGLDGKLLFPPGERFAYSNIAYEVLGDVIAKVSGKCFEDLVEAEIFLPLKMFSSSFLSPTLPEDKVAAPHLIDLGTHVSPIYPYHRAHAPSSTLHATIEDMNRWAIAVLNRKSGILKEATFDAMWQPQMSVGQIGRSDKYSGLGWFIDRRRNLKLLYHSGSDVGFTTYFLLVPEKSIGITVLCNTAPAPVEEIAFGILDEALGFEPSMIKAPVMLPLGTAYLAGGLAALQARYAELKDEGSQDYDFGLNGFLNAAASMLDNQQNSQAIDVLSFSLELFPESAKAYEMLARAYFQCGNFEQAMQSAWRSLALEPDNPFLRQQVEGLM